MWASAGILNFEIAQMLREENVIDVNGKIAYENYAAAVDRGISKLRIWIFVGKRRYFRFEIALIEIAYEHYAAEFLG